jgi:hypothetical protein
MEAGIFLVDHAVNAWKWIEWQCWGIPSKQSPKPPSLKVEDLMYGKNGYVIAGTNDGLYPTLPNPNKPHKRVMIQFIDCKEKKAYTSMGPVRIFHDRDHINKYYSLKCEEYFRGLTHKPYGFHRIAENKDDIIMYMEDWDDFRRAYMQSYEDYKDFKKAKRETMLNMFRDLKFGNIPMEIPEFLQRLSFYDSLKDPNHPENNPRFLELTRPDGVVDIKGKMELIKLPCTVDNWRLHQSYPIMQQL